MGWRCVLMRKQLPLYVGEDLTGQEQSSVEKHLDQCAACRNHLESLQQCRRAMVDCQALMSDVDMPSLWPCLQRQLRQPAVTPDRSHWLTVSAMLAASIAIGLMIWNRSPGPASITGPNPMVLSNWAASDPDWAARLSAHATRSPIKPNQSPDGPVPAWLPPVSRDDANLRYISSEF